jgi:DNA-binding IclR family transcriptional regulator
MTSTLSDNVDALKQYSLPPSMVERMTLIMDSFGDAQTRLTLEQVTSHTNLPRSTVHRILEQLVRLRWLDHHGRDYALGPRALGFAGREVGHERLRAAAFPMLHALAARTDMVVHLAVLDRADVYYLDKVSGKNARDVPSRVGGRAPAHCTAIGKSMLAWLSPERVDALCPNVIKRTTRSIGDLGVLHQELSRIRARNGLAYERGECFPHIACVGAAVRGPDGPIGGISITSDVKVGLERLAPLLIGTVHAVSEKLLGGAAQKESSGQKVANPPSASSEVLGRLVAMAEGGDWF